MEGRGDEVEVERRAQVWVEGRGDEVEVERKEERRWVQLVREFPPSAVRL